MILYKIEKIYKINYINIDNESKGIKQSNYIKDIYL